MSADEPAKSHSPENPKPILYPGGRGAFARANAIGATLAMMSTYSYRVVEPSGPPKKQKPKHEPHPLTLAQRKKILAKRIAARGKK